MSNVQDVIETRIKICDWLQIEDFQSEDSYREERDALYRELNNLHARSDLDSTRVHVDEDSLREWFIDTQQATITRYVQAILSSGRESPVESLLTFYAQSKESAKEEDRFLEDNQIGPEFVLVNIVEETLKTFCSDKMFGLDSYLSRRIRHGTLNGHIINPINRIISNFKGYMNQRTGTEPEIINMILDGLLTWQKRLTIAIDSARKEIIQVQSDKYPNGLIKGTWRNAANVTHLDAMITRIRDRILASAGKYDLFPDLHSFCWDCLEGDLAQLRLYMTRTFYPNAIGELQAILSTLPPQANVTVGATISEMRQTLEARTQEVCGWFIRPVFRRDKYDLTTLVSSIIAVIRDLNDSYKFSDKISITENISVNRGGFEVFGDILFILVGNAARHGAPQGAVTIEAKMVSEAEKLISLKVTSNTTGPENYFMSRNKIKSAIQAREVSILRAAVEEGFSGLGKLLGLLRRVRSPNVALHLEEPNELGQICLSVIVPAEITFRRERT